MADHPSQESTLRNWHPLEYAHVFLWLVKDMCWALHWTTFGCIMVIPTVLTAYVITWIQRKQAVVLIHNLAISFWISANSLWMLAEFYELESVLKPFAVVGFGSGLAILIGWYASQIVKKVKVT
jgi:hypothetical protein